MVRAKKIAPVIPLVGMAVGIVLWAGSAFAAHNGALIDVGAPGACGETTITAAITDPAGTHKVNNMRLVVHADGETQFTDVIPTIGDTVSLTVGPFFGAAGDTVEVSWRVFGGGERNYDDPLWNGFGDASFNSDIAAYGAQNGFEFVVAGPEDPNPFTTWHDFDVEGCTKDDCKDGGWQELFTEDGDAFENQGDCIQYVNTGE